VVIDDDLDGEDKLLLIGPPKEKRTKRKTNSIKAEKRRGTTGRWRSEIHDYFPGGIDDEERLVEGQLLGDIGRNERMALRRELAELGEKMAKADRIRRRGCGL
jgi:hypothetical protein